LPVDTKVVESRIRKIEESVVRLREIAEMPGNPFLSDPRTYPAMERHFQVAIQSVLDIGAHLIAEQGLREPEGYTDILGILGEAGVIPREFSERIQGMAGLRNILVHDYMIVDRERLTRLLQDLDDFGSFCRYVAEYIHR
jgi:uncharacterized protein YutE (UPF0331/DUF86 family)